MQLPGISLTGFPSINPSENLSAFRAELAANHAVRSAFENLLEKPVYVSDRHKVIGALGVALLAREAYERGDYSTRDIDPGSSKTSGK